MFIMWRYLCNSFKSDSLLFNLVWSCKFHSGHILCFEEIFTHPTISYPYYFPLGVLGFQKSDTEKNAIKCYLGPITLERTWDHNCRLEEAKLFYLFSPCSCELRRIFKRFKMMALSQLELNLDVVGHLLVWFCI